MDKQEIFMKGYLNGGIKVTFLDNLFVIGTYINYYNNNVIVILPIGGPVDRHLFIPLSAIKTIGPWSINTYDYLEDD
ncbi:hypothetical protein KDC22_07380 [Paenibacillus tritici]|uniref:hypothetical protein n=1 Tax=Paenibacillus tritici TaxID=1873425 RepID=UPI001BABA3DD|nr:hypothetical protein [Paenibacillus tritici]QUL56319.1 hypothetical protein KDC22_07380 [Paenibacillus tritici]